MKSRKTLGSAIVFWGIIFSFPIVHADTYSVRLPHCRAELKLSIPASFEPSFVDNSAINKINELPRQTQTVVTIRKRSGGFEQEIHVGGEEFRANWVGIGLTELGSLGKSQGSFDETTLDTLYAQMVKMSTPSALKEFIEREPRSTFYLENLKEHMRGLSKLDGISREAELNRSYFLSVKRGRSDVTFIQYFPMRINSDFTPFLKGMKYALVSRVGCIGNIVIDAPMEVTSMKQLQDLLEQTTLQ